MRFYLSIFFLVIWIAASSQEKTVSFSTTQRLTVSELLTRLNENGVNIVFSPSFLPSEELRIGAGQYSVSSLLDMLESFNIHYQVQGDQYLIDTSNLNRTKRISGYIRDDHSGEAIIGATISIDGGRHGVVTNNYGYYALSVRPGVRSLEIRSVGYHDNADTLHVYNSTVNNYNLIPATTELDEVVIESGDPLYHVQSMIPSEKFLDFELGGDIPYFLGEVDVIQKSMLLPGIRTLGEDASGLNVRGGDIDQNLILLDEAVIYNPNHFYGLISVFNPEAVNRVKVMKGFIPPSYGGRASSVIAVYQKEGNKNNFGVSGGLGIVSARLLVEGPIQKEKSSFLVSARQSIYDLSLDGFNNSFFRGSNTSFQDVNLKLNWMVNDNNTLFISGYFGDDRNRAGFDAIRKWGNRTLSARWTHSYNKRLFANYSAVFSDYVYRITDPVEAGSFIGKSSIRDYTLKLHHQYFQNIHSRFDFGGDITFHRLRPGERLPFDEGASSTNAIALDKEHGIEYGLYFGHEFDFEHTVKVMYGLRYSGLATFGPDDLFTYARDVSRSNSTIIDTMHIDHRERVDHFQNIEPRVSVNFSLSEKKAIKLSYSRANQYVHLISNTAAPAPTDTWKLSDRYIQPLESDHFTLGYYQTLGLNNWKTSLELYFKDLDNLIEYKNGANLLFNANPETELINGTGRAYGVEYYLEKTTGRYRGWLSYTLSRSERQIKGRFPDETINNGEYFPDDHDKTHDLSLVGIYDHSDQWNFSVSFNYASGRPITFPTGKYELNGVIVPYFEGRNQNRITDYHRLDVATKWTPGKKKKKKKKWRLKENFWTLTIYNVYGRRNAYSYFFRQSPTDPNQTEVVRYSIFGTIIPAVTYNFKF